MGDPSSLGKLTASLEDLSLKKQLPLRQQAQKPMLKYSNSAIKPVQLFNHADLVSIRSNAEAARNAYSSLSQASTTSTITNMNTINTPFRSSLKQSPSPQTLLKQATGTNGPASMSASNMSASKPSSSKGHSNPYARPISAKDIVNDLHNQKMRKSPSAPMNSAANFTIPGGAGTPMFGFQMNSFMRPQSALRKDPPSSVHPKSDTKNNNYSSNGSIKATSRSNSGEEEDKKSINKGPNSPRKPGPPPTKLERERDLSETISDTGAKTVAQLTKNIFGPAKSAPNVAQDTVKQITNTDTNRGVNSGSSSGTKVAAACQTPNSAVSKMHEASNTAVKKVFTKSSESSTNVSTKSVIYAKPVSSLPRPGSAANQSSSTTTATQESPSKVRNLNYTPTKPYSEVMDPSPSPSNSVITGKPPVSGASKVQQTTETAITGRSDTTKHGTTYIAPNNIERQREKESKAASNSSSASSKGSSTNVTHGTTTQYYRKESKADVMIHEQRPPAVGAPSKLAKQLEKGSRSTLISGMSGSELDEMDDESEPGIPSGERMPGDGEASIDGDDDDDDLGDDEDDLVDDLEDDAIGGSDGESDGYSFTSSSLSRRSSSAHRLKSRPVSGASTDMGGYTRPQTASPDRTVKPGFTKSLFPNIPPVVTFVAEGEKVEQLPWDIRKYLKWRLSPITPNVVKHCLARTGFRITKRNHDWLGCWGKHMKSPAFKALREYQKLNHFPGSFQIGRKDRLWRNLSKMQVHFGKKEFGFFPQTFCLPQDSKLCKRAFEDGGPKQKWIIKPPASARGIGIKVINKITQIPKKKPVIVQKYLARPYLINDSKFDLRIYVYVSSMDPLRIYVFEDGLARFASMKYSSSMKHLGNKFMHLTNYSVNKKNADYQSNADDSVCQGHKWSLKALWNYMKRQGINTTAIWESIKDLIVKTIICSDAPVNSLIKANCKSRYCVHELFGFDILLDESLRPWILEVNISPSLHSNSQLDINIKGHMIRDLLNIAGFRVPDKHDLAHSPPQTSGPPDLSNYSPSNNYCLDKRLFAQQLSPDERAKHAYYSQRYQDEQVLQSMLDTLTPDDIRILTESIDEDSRKGGFQRVFPTPSTHRYLKYFETPRYYNLLLDQWVQRYNRMEQRGTSKPGLVWERIKGGFQRVFPTPSTHRYLKYFETPRYYNLLLDQWVQRYNRMEQRGISLLQSYCDECIHLNLCTENQHHQWNPPNATCHSYREGRLLSAPLSKQKEADALKASHSSSTVLKGGQKRVMNHKHATPPQRSISQSSSASSVNTLVFSPQPADIMSPKGKVPNR